MKGNLQVQGQIKREIKIKSRKVIHKEIKKLDKNIKSRETIYIKILYRLLEMAKSKNSTNKNQISKSHRQGIKKPKENRHISTKGVNARFLRNRRRAIKNDPSIKKNKSLEKRVAKK